MYYKDKAVIIKSIDFQESSKIVTFLTKTNGSLTCIAKGARKPKSKFTGHLTTGALCEIGFTYKDSRQVQLLTDIESIAKTYKIHQNFSKLSILMRTLEMIDQFSAEMLNMEDLFLFTESIINWLITESDIDTSIFPYILVRLADISGFAIQVNKNQELGNNTFFFNIDSGTISHTSSEQLSFKLHNDQAKYLIFSIEHKGKKLSESGISSEHIEELTHHLDVYFKHHIEGFKDRKSDKIFSELNQI